MATATQLLTAEEYIRRRDDMRHTELVRGEIVEMNMPASRHGQICARIARILGNFADEHQLGHVISNDSGVVTERHPDTVRGADVAYYSFNRVPAGPLPWGYLPVPPEVIVEVRSPSDRWPRILAKVAEYLDIGVGVVCVADESTQSVFVYRAEENTVVPSERELTLPELHSDFRIPVRRFFE